MQGTVDVGAIVASSNMSDPENAVLNYFVTNKMNLGVVSGTTLLTASGTVPYDPKTVFSGRDGYATLTKGHYVPDTSVAIGSRFQPGETPSDAVQVNLFQRGTLMFASAFIDPPTMKTSGTAAIQKVAAFSIGSRVASLNGGVLNSLLGALLGTTISLNLMDYQSLLSTDINLLSFLDLLASDFGVTAGSYDDLLATNISYPKLLNALGRTAGLTPAVASIVNNLTKTVNKTNVNLNLGEILDLGSAGTHLIGQGNNLSVKANVFNLINAAAVAGNGNSQVSVDLGGNVPGLVSSKVTLAIGSPAVAIPSSAVGGEGTTVRTPQTRLSIEVQTTGIGDLLGIKVRLPLYVDVAYAEAQLAAIRCAGTGRQNGEIDVKVVPGAAEIDVGDVDTAAFAHFGTKPRVTRATLVQITSLIGVSALASIDTGNLAAKTVTFSGSDITSGKTVTVSSSNTVTALVTSLLGNLQLRIDLIGLPIILPPSLLQGLATLLSGLTTPVDSLLFNLLAVLGVHIGEADVRATALSCVNPALVQ